MKERIINIVVSVLGMAVLGVAYAVGFVFSSHIIELLAEKRRKKELEKLENIAEKISCKPDECPDEIESLDDSQ